MVDPDELFEALGDPRAPGRATWTQIAKAFERPEQVLARLIPRAIIDGSDPNAPADPAKVSLVQVGAGALLALAKDATVVLSAEQLAGLSFLRQIAGRPAMPVIEGKCGTPPPQWKFLHKEARDVIDDAASRVGRIDAGAQQVGTGFVVSSGVVMTNRHVVKSFLKPDGSKTLREDHGLAIDFDKQLGGGSDRFAIEELLFISEEKPIDLAILRIAGTGENGKAPPSPLSVLNDRPMSEGGVVYAIGYPAEDNAGDTPLDVMALIFGPDVGIKRVQPGLLTAVPWTEPRHVHHDCSTLGGSSGSCLIDFATGMVCGLHFRGVYAKTNIAVALWMLASDPNIKPHVKYG